MQADAFFLTHTHTRVCTFPVFRGKMISAELEAAVLSAKKQVNDFLRGDL